MENDEFGGKIEGFHKQDKVSEVSRFLSIQLKI